MASTRVGVASFDLAVLVTREPEIVAEVLLTCVKADAQEKIPRPVADAVAKAFRAKHAKNVIAVLEIHQ